MVADSDFPDKLEAVLIARHAVQRLLRAGPGETGLLFGRAEQRTLRVETLSPVTQITKSEGSINDTPIGFWLCGDPKDPPAVPEALSARWPEARLRVLVDPTTDGRLEALAWLAPDQTPLPMDMLEDAPLSAKAASG
ncbi:MAG: hypothetical protein R8K47_02045 [Mariprofundaceae bacterium]